MLVCLQLLLQVAGGSAAQSDTSLELKASVKAAAWLGRCALRRGRRQIRRKSFGGDESNSSSKSYATDGAAASVPENLAGPRLTMVAE